MRITGPVHPKVCSLATMTADVTHSLEDRTKTWNQKADHYVPLLNTDASIIFKMLAVALYDGWQSWKLPAEPSGVGRMNFATFIGQECLANLMKRFILGPVGAFLAAVDQRNLITDQQTLDGWTRLAVQYTLTSEDASGTDLPDDQKPLLRTRISDGDTASIVDGLMTLPGLTLTREQVSDVVEHARRISAFVGSWDFSADTAPDLSHYRNFLDERARQTIQAEAEAEPEAEMARIASSLWCRMTTLGLRTNSLLLRDRHESETDSALRENASSNETFTTVLDLFWNALAERTAEFARKLAERERVLEERRVVTEAALAERAAASAAAEAAAAESARRQYAEKCAQAVKYFADFRKVPLSPELDELVQSLGSRSVKQQVINIRDALVEAIEYAREFVVDGRGLRTEPDPSAPTVTCDPDVASFAALLFGKENVVQMLLAKGLELKPFHLAPPSHTPNLDVLGRVSELYERSAAVGAIVDQLGSLDDTIGLVATLGLPVNQVRDGQREELVAAMRKSFSDASTVRRAKVRLTQAERESLGGEAGKGADLGSVATTLGLAPSEWRLEQQGSGVLVVELGEQQPPPVVVVLTKGELKEPSRLKGTFNKKLAEARLNAEVERGINFLEHNSGLVVERDAQGVPVRVSHPGCDLGEDMPTPLGHFWRELDRIQSMVLAYQSRVEALQVSLETAGFKLNVEARRVTVRTPAGATVEVSPSQYLTSEQFAQIENILRTPASTSASTTAGAVKGSVRLESKDEVLVVDAGVLMRLGIGNEHGGSFLEVLSAAASSKGNIRVWIPSTVYTELTGKAIFVQDGQVRAKELWSGGASPALTDFFNSCSHVSLQNDGTVSVPTRGRANERICIVHSDGDAQLFSASVSARTAKEGSEASARELWTRQGRGDDSITWIIEHLRGDQRGITVATLDRVYTSTKMPRRCNNERPVIPLMLEQMLAALTSLPYVQEELRVGAGYGSYASRIIQDNARIEPSLRFSWRNPLGPGGLAAFLTRIGPSSQQAYGLIERSK